MITKSEISALMSAVSEVMREYVGGKTVPLEKRIDELDAAFKKSEEVTADQLKRAVDLAWAKKYRVGDEPPIDVADMAEVFVKGLLEGETVIAGPKVIYVHSSTADLSDPATA